MPNNKRGTSGENAADKKAAINLSINKEGRLEPEPSDREIEDILALKHSEKFESGIYNYCDRWCEKCPDTAKCFLYAQEELQKTNQESAKENENDLSSELMYSFKTTRKIIERTNQEHGIEIDDTGLDEAEIKRDQKRDDDLRQTECLTLAEEYMKETGDFLKNYYDTQNGYKEELSLDVDQSDIKDEIEALTWYHTMIPTKVWRVLYERESINEEEDEELKGIIRKDQEKFFALLDKMFENSRVAFARLALKRRDYVEDIAHLLAKLELLEISMREEFKLPVGYNVMVPEFNEEQLEAMKVYADNSEEGFMITLDYFIADPGNRVSYGMIGDMYMNTRAFKSAIIFLTLGSRYNPNEPILHYLWGVALSKIGRFNEGLIRLKRAQELSPQDGEIKRNIGWVTAIRGRFKDDNKEIERGRSVLRDVVKAEPENVLAMTDLGQSYLMAQDFDSAHEWTEQAIKIEPENDFVRMIHSDVIEMRNQYKLDPNFKEFVEKRKVLKAYSGPPVKTDEEMDEQVEKQFEIEELIGELNGDDLKKEEVEKVMSKLKASGMVGQITAISDENSKDGQAATQYIQFHQEIPNVEEKKSEAEVNKLANKLFTKGIKLHERKKIVIVLAHQGTETALKALEKYQKQARGEMKVWLKMAIDECRAFMQSGEDGPGMFFSKI